MSLTSPHSISGPRSGVWVAWRLTRGALAAVALVAAVVGVPCALLQYTSWPISGVPTWEQISDFPVALVTQDSVVIGIFTVGLWAEWTVFSVCVVIEVVTEIRGTNRTRVPAAGPLQGLARSLVASVAMTFGSLGSLTTHGASGSFDDSAAALTATAVVLAPETSAVADAPPLPPDTDPAARWEVVTVEHGDTAWELAELHYGDGTQWLRLWDDNQHELQPDGRTWANQSDPVEPGWRLRVRAPTCQPSTPASSMVAGTTAGTPNTEPASAPVDPAEAEVTIQPGDNFWSLAADRLEGVLGRPPTDDEIAPYWVQVIETNTDRLVQIDNPDLIYPGQTFVLPAVGQTIPAADAPGTSTPPHPSPPEPPPEPAESPPGAPQRPDSPTTATVPADTSPPSTDQPATTEPSGTDTGDSPTSTGTTRPQPTSTAPAGTSPPSPNQPGSDDGDPSTVTVIGTLTAGTALAVGVIHAMRQRRRRRNHRHAATARPSSNPRLHRDLIAAADESIHSQLRHALHGLASALAEADAPSRPRIVQHDAEHLDVLLDIPTQPATDGWTAEAAGAVWSCDLAQLGPADHHEQPATTPLLVTLGRPDAGGQLYLDLEAEGVISLCGEPNVARDVARAMVTELAHSPLAGAAQIIVVGDLGTSSVAALDRTTVVDDWASVADNLHAWAEQSHDALVRNDWSNAFVARAHHDQHDALIPLAVFTDQPLDDPQDLAELQAIEPRAAAVVVVGQEVSDATVIDCAPGRLSLPQLGLVCEPQPLDVGHFDAIVDLLDDAEHPAGEQLQLLPDDTPPTEHEDRSGGGPPVTSNGGPYQDPPYDVLVRLLGDITVEGAMKRLTPKQTTVLAYIALHRAVSSDRAGDALWPDQAPSWRRRLSNTVSACRNAIGGHHLPLADDSTYRAGPRLLTDTELFTRRMAAATSQPPSQAIETLRGALDLVRGPVFHYPDNERTPYAWVSLEDWISVWEHKITAVACQLVDAYMSAGNTQDAVEIAQRIHGIVPTDTALTELLMRCYAANGDRVAVRRVYHAHLDALAALDLDDPADSTAALYDELRNASTA